MSDYVLSCCSTADLTHDWLESRNIKYVLFNYYLNGEVCKDDFGATNSPADLYAKMLAGAEAKTSQISAGDYMAHFEKFLSAGKDILHVTLSTGISGTYNSACTARDQLAEKYPDRKIIVIDSLAASSGYGLLVDKMADLRDSGMGIDELATWAEDHKSEVQHWFFSSDLTFFVRGGRISKAAGLVGGMLKICPVMDVEPDGSLAVKEKIVWWRRWRSSPRAVSTTPASASSPSPSARTTPARSPTASRPSSPSSTARSRSSPSVPPSASTPVLAPWPSSSGARSASSAPESRIFAPRSAPERGAFRF